MKVKQLRLGPYCKCSTIEGEPELSTIRIIGLIADQIYLHPHWVT